MACEIEFRWKSDDKRLENASLFVDELVTSLRGSVEYSNIENGEYRVVIKTECSSMEKMIPKNFPFQVPVPFYINTKRDKN